LDLVDRAFHGLQRFAGEESRTLKIFEEGEEEVKLDPDEV
jgi:hypothetical protein